MSQKSTPMLLTLIACIVAALQHSPASAQEQRDPKHSYPTAARADYVIGCLAANGMKRELLPRCSCEIDAIADQLNYDDYEQASTVLSMQQGGGGPAFDIFRDTTVAKTEMAKLNKAQAEANLRCN
jgi:hypothetical protein